MMIRRASVLAFVCLAMYSQSHAIWPFNSGNKKKETQKSFDAYPEYTKEYSTGKQYSVVTEHMHLKNNLSTDAAQFLKLFDVKKEEFTHFKGTLQQCEINDFLIDIINQSCTVNKLISQETNIAQYALIYAILLVHDLNKKGQIDTINTVIESFIEHKEDHIKAVRSLVDEQATDDKPFWFTILNSVTNDLVIYSTQLITLISLEATLNQFVLPKADRAERLQALYHTLKKEFFALYHPVTKHQADTLEDVFDFGKQLALGCHEQFLNSIIAEKQYKTLK